METAAKLKIRLADSVMLNLDALLSSDGKEAAVIAELPGDSILSLLKREMICSLEDTVHGTRQGRIANVIKNGRRQLIEVRLRPLKP